MLKFFVNKYIPVQDCESTVDLAPEPLQLPYKTVHYVVIGYWEKSGCKVIAEYPSEDPSHKAIVLSTIDGLKFLEDDKISFDRGKYTVHLLIGELHYACLTSKPDCPSAVASLQSCSQVFLERLRNVYRELPILADLSRDLTSLAIIDLSEPLKKMAEEYNQEPEIIPRLEGELAEIRRALMDGVQKLIDRGQRLEELVQKTQTLQLMSRKDFQLTRSSRKRRNAKIAVGAAMFSFVSASLFVFLIYIELL